MSGHLWYNSVVAKQFEKKSVNLPMKVQESMLEQIQLIAATEDRPVGYVARELMIRGLNLYRVDGRLRDDASPSPAAAEPVTTRHVVRNKIVGTITPGERTTTKADVRRMLAADAELLEPLTTASSKAKKVKHLGEITDKNAEKKRKTG